VPQRLPYSGGMKRSARRAVAPKPRGPTPTAPLVPLTTRLVAVPVAVAATLVLLAVTYRIDDPDLWQHLTVGRAIWAAHAVPATNVWTWPGYGQPYLVPSWLFRVLLWPFWAAGGLWGLAAWRWITTLAAFALLWRASVRAGARGLVPLLVMVACALVFRQRSQLRPDTLVAVLLALELWLLESRRGGGRVHVAWLVVLGWAWANWFPIIKILWTSSYVLFAGGWSLLLLAIFYGIIDVLRFRAWAFFFVVIGANSITIYLLRHVIDFAKVGHFFFGGLEKHAAAYGPVVAALGVLGAEWLLLLYLYRRRLFLRV